MLNSAVIGSVFYFTIFARSNFHIVLLSSYKLIPKFVEVLSDHDHVFTPAHKRFCLHLPKRNFLAIRIIDRRILLIPTLGYNGDQHLNLCE